MQNMQNPNNKVAVRYPPSPTGNLHIGNIRTILFNYLFAKHAERLGTEASMIMRFEDTDKERSKAEYEQVALDTLDALGITFTDGPYRQSGRTNIYIQAIQKLIENNMAYEGEKSKDNSEDRVIRFKNPNKKITFTDAVRGNITIDTTDFGDFIIARSFNNPLYHLTVVVDDIDMGITHIIRGEDHITSTPRQILLIEALGSSIPQYAHLPLIIGSDKKKLGKRHGAVTYQEFEKVGYLPSAIINYLALLGWSEGNDREFYSMEELEKAFTLENVSKSPAMFSYEKLDSVNRHYLLQLPDTVYEQEVQKYLTKQIQIYLDTTNKAVRHTILHTIIKDRISKWGDVQNVCNTELSWLKNTNQLNKEKIAWKESSNEATKKHINNLITLLKTIPKNKWEQVTNREATFTIKNTIWEYAETIGRGEVLWPMRYSLTGEERSPDPFTVAFILGKEETIARLELAKSLL